MRRFLAAKGGALCRRLLRVKSGTARRGSRTREVTGISFRIIEKPKVDWRLWTFGKTDKQVEEVDCSS
jgi:hypothetical protein